MKRLPTITIGISAYNEEANIGFVLEDILNQKITNARLKEIIVISDGSDDFTCREVLKVKDKRVVLIEGRTRAGKATRVNHIISKFQSDFLFMFDGDVRLNGNNVIEKMVKKFQESSRVGVVQGKVQPMKAKTFIEKAINNYFYSRDELVHIFNYGESVYGARAGCMALRKDFAKTIHLPKFILNDDAFIYMHCILSGWTFVYEGSVGVWYRSAQTISDFQKQLVRYANGENQIHEYFMNKRTYDEYVIPHEILIKILYLQLRKNILGYILLKSVSLYSKLYISHMQKTINYKWSFVTSSKIL